MSEHDTTTEPAKSEYVINISEELCTPKPAYIFNIAEEIRNQSSATTCNDITEDTPVASPISDLFDSTTIKSTDDANPILSATSSTLSNFSFSHVSKAFRVSEILTEVSGHLHTMVMNGIPHTPMQDVTVNTFHLFDDEKHSASNPKVLKLKTKKRKEKKKSSRNKNRRSTFENSLNNFHFDRNLMERLLNLQENISETIKILKSGLGQTAIEKDINLDPIAVKSETEAADIKAEFEKDFIVTDKPHQYKHTSVYDSEHIRQKLLKRKLEIASKSLEAPVPSVSSRYGMNFLTVTKPGKIIDVERLSMLKEMVAFLPTARDLNFVLPLDTSDKLLMVTDDEDSEKVKNDDDDENEIKQLKQIIDELSKAARDREHEQQIVMKDACVGNESSMPIGLPSTPRYCLCKKVKSTPLFKGFRIIKTNKKNDTKVIKTQSVIMSPKTDLAVPNLESATPKRDENTKNKSNRPIVEKQVYLTRYNYLPYNIPLVKKIDSMLIEERKIVTTAFEPLNEVIKIESGTTLEDKKDYESCSRESLEALPYSINVDSLPNMNICRPQQLKVQYLRGKMRDGPMDHADPYVQKQLGELGRNNLIRASMPAESTRDAVLNQIDRDDEPYHASLNSLPLSTSDLELITASLDPGDMKSTIPIKSSPLIACYGNFQNLRIDPCERCHVYHIWFFGIFGGDKSKTKRISLAERFMNLIFGDDGEAEKKMHNKKCQINIAEKKEEKSSRKVQNVVKNKPSKEVSVLKNPPLPKTFCSQVICNECMKGPEVHSSSHHRNHQNLEDISARYLTNEELLDILTQKVLNESTSNNRKKRKEPKSVTSIISIKKQKKTKTRSKIPQPVLKHRYSEMTNETDHHLSKKQKKASSAPKISTEKKCSTSKTKIILTECVDNYSDDKVLSLESLKMLASKNGPGYLSVLHPVCGCPEVSIFVPCYCSEKERPACCNQALSLRTLNKLRSSSGKHVVLPRTCRIGRPDLEISKH